MAYKACEYCGKQFEAVHGNQRYCSKECMKGRLQKKRLEKIRFSTPVKGKRLLEWCNENGEYGQKILSEYSDKNELTPKEISAGSGRQVYWNCSVCGYEWITVLVGRIQQGTGCPKCNGRLLTDNNLYLWCMSNGERGQKILREYSFKNEVTPEQIAPKSGKRLHWECSNCGNEWESILISRTLKQADCPVCSRVGTSYGEQIIYYVLKRELDGYEVLNRTKVEGYEIDVFIPVLKFGIEYSGYAFHKNRVKQDNAKDEALKRLGYNIINILEKESEQEKLNCDFSFVRGQVLNPDEMLNYLKAYMKDTYNISLDIGLSVEEKEACKKRSIKKYIDVDVVILLKVLGKSQKESGKILGVSSIVPYTKLHELSEEDLAQREEDIECVYRFTRFGDSAERIASDFDLDLDFVEKIQSFIKKYANGYKAPEMEESTLEVEEGDNNNEEESISNFNDDNGDDEFIWL